MPEFVRTLVCLAIVSTSSVAAAQIVDPWPDASTSNNAPQAPPSEQAPASMPAAATQPTPDSKTPAKPARPIDPAPSTLSMRRPGEWIEHHAPVMRPTRLRPEPPPQQAQVADEPPPRRYPLELAARPLVLPPGVTELSASYQRRTFTVKQQQYGGIATKEVSSNTPDLNLSHAFSRAELGIGLGQAVYSWVAIDTQQFPERVQIAAAFSTPQDDGRYAHFQSVTVAHKLCCEVDAAVIAGGGAYLNEVNVDNDSGTRINGELVTASGGVTLVLQAADRFALTFGGGASVPVIEFEELGVPTVWSGSAGMLLAADSWDVVLRGAFATSSATLVELGLKKRWGL